MDREQGKEAIESLLVGSLEGKVFQHWLNVRRCSGSSAWNLRAAEISPGVFLTYQPLISLSGLSNVLAEATLARIPKHIPAPVSWAACPWQLSWTVP